MKKRYICITTLILASCSVFCQDNDYIKPPTLALYFFFNDFESAAKIRASSLSAALRDKQFGKLREMTPGFAASYLRGLSPNIDISATLAASFLEYPFENKPLTGSEGYLLEADASIHAKMFNDHYWVVPYLSAGIGASKYKGYYGAFIPVGAGLQFNIFRDTFILFNTQYRIKVDDNTNYHFYHSIGVAGNIGGRE